MKVAVRQGGQERTVLSAMITDRAVLGRLSSRWGEGDLFASRWANIVATWCVDYYRNYQDAPKKAIVPLYTKWCEGAPDPEIVALIDQFLASLSQEAQTCPEMAPECVLDLAGALFRRVRLSRLRDALEGDLEANLAEEAERRVEGYRRVDLGAGARVNPFNDPSVLETLFQREEEPPLVQYPGALGTFWGRTLDRDQLVAFQCPEKGGKSFLLMDISYRAMCQRRKVAYFEAGDLSERQVLRRFLARASRHPTHNPHGDWPYVVKYPVSVRRNEDEEAGVTVGTKDVSYSEPLTASKAREAMNRVLSCNVKSRKPYLSLSVHPNSSLSVAMIRGILESWGQDDGWVPDVVVVDYADILAPPAGTEKKDEQAQVDATWRQLRRMSQELHCLVLTATQSKATAYGKHTQDASDFSRDKRKHAHVSAMVGINATEAEAEQQVKRLNYLRRRDGEANSRRCVTVAGCLALASPCVLSTF